MERIHGSKIFLALLVLTVCMGTMRATNVLTATPSTVTLSCNTTSGPGLSATVVVKPATPLTGINTVAVTLGSLTGGVVVTPPTLTTLSTANQAAGLVYTVNLAAGCVGVANGAPTFRFSAAGTPDVTVTANTTVTATASALVPAPSPVVLTCVRTSGGVYTPGAAQTVSVTSAAVGGTPFTVDNSTNAPPNWLTIGSPSASSAGTTGTTFTVVAAAGCGAFAAGSTNTATLHLLNAPAPDKLVPVTLQVLAPSTLTATPSPATLSYVKGSGSAGHVDVNVTSAASPAPFFSVDTTSLPIWLTVDSTNGTAPKSIRFTSTSVADTLAPGTYTASVRFKVSGVGDLPLTVTLLVTNTAPRLTVAEGPKQDISWTLGQPLPTPFITAVSSDSPIPYTLTTGGTLAPIIAASQQKGLAYGFGTKIPVTFDPLLFAAAQPGAVLTGTVTLTWGNPASTIVVTFNVTIQSPGATMTGITPASLPTAPSGQTFTVVLTGTGFVPSTDPSQKTKVGVVVGNSIVPDTNISTNVVNASNIILTITVPVAADPYLPFSPSGTGGLVNLGVCNPAGLSCTIPTGTGSLTIGSNPIIQAVTSASAFLQVSPPTLQTVAPYDMLSIFGAGFCSANGTGCGSSQVMYGTPDPTTLRYPTTLSPDASGTGQRFLSVTFQTRATPPVVIATAPLLFGTNGQINLVVPSQVSSSIGSSVDMVVNFGYGSGSTMKSSTPFTVNVAATNPGIFTLGADGQGDGAVLSTNWAVVSGSNPAGMRSTAADSDTVQIYVTGLGAPDSTADNANAGTVGGAVWSTDCISTSTYLTSLNNLNSGSLTTLDGTIIQSTLLNRHRLVPCVLSSSANVPTVTVGGIAAPVVYAGWVADSIAGLYQVNVRLPGSAAGSFTQASGPALTSITAPVQLPVVVTARGRASQSGVTMWVAPKLMVVAPTATQGTVGVSWPSSNNSVVASEGTGNIQYALTSGLLPSGLSLNATTGAITGTPAAYTTGAYVVTVTATDSANVPVSGDVTFKVQVAGGLVMSAPGTPFSASSGSGATVTTVQAAGGTYPYTYAITAPVSLPAGLAIDANTGVITITSGTPAGLYHVTVQATDSTSGTPLTGTITFDITLT